VKPKRTLGVGIAVATALLASACAAGQRAVTAAEKPTLQGTDAQVGSIHLLGFLIEAPSGSAPSYAAGDSAQVKLVLVNTGSKPDTLVSISSPAISDWGAFKSTSDAAAVLEPSRSSTPSPSPTSSAASPTRTRTKTKTSSPTTSASGSASDTTAPSTSSAGSSASTTSAAPSPLPTPDKQVVIPPGSRVSWGTPESTGVLALLHLTKKTYPGTTISLTVRFAQAGSITLDVPVALSGSPNTTPIPDVTSTFEA
jgi:copper(I)-binding protein